MVIKTETQRPGEFIISEANAGSLSRDAGTLSSGQNLTDGTLLALVGGELVAYDTTNTFEGILIGDFDASTTGTNADIKGVPYISRLAEVDTRKLVYPEVQTESDTDTDGLIAASNADLLARFIVPR